jgi:hypothetical protein
VNETKRLKALDVIWAMQKLVTQSNYSDLKDKVALETNPGTARSEFNKLCTKANIAGDLRKYLWIILRDESIVGAHTIHMENVADAPYCWS